MLDFQWDVVQRQDMSIGLVEPAQRPGARICFGNCPGVDRGRAVPARRSCASASAIAAGSWPSRACPPSGAAQPGDRRATTAQIALPPDGLVVSAKLAEVLGAQVGRRTDGGSARRANARSRTVPLVGLAEDFAGMAAYMDMQALNRLLGEGDVITGASFTVDDAQRRRVPARAEGHPAGELGGDQGIAAREFPPDHRRQHRPDPDDLPGFAIVVAFGVVYNNARISLAERARELATLRVIGFSRREVGAVLVTELVILALMAVPLGCCWAPASPRRSCEPVNTETVRLPLVLTRNNYAFAVLVVTVASTLSALVVLRKLNQLNLVGALKAPE